jgi:hypothetical protein
MASSILAAANGGLQEDCELQHDYLEIQLYIRDKDSRSISTRLLYGILDACEDGLSKMCLTSFLWIRATNNIRA